jgi:hypothetical protein
MSSKLYTNVFKMNDKIYARFDTGTEIIDFKPTMYVSSSKDKSDQWKTMRDEIPVYPIKPGSMKDTDNFIEQYKNTSGIIVNGYPNYVAQFISEQYPEEIQWDIDKLNIVAIDIETTASMNFGNKKIKIRKNKS